MISRRMPGAALLAAFAAVCLGCTEGSHSGAAFGNSGKQGKSAQDRNTEAGPAVPADPAGPADPARRCVDAAGGRED